MKVYKTFLVFAAILGFSAVAAATTFNDGFEDGDISEYTGDKGAATAQDRLVIKDSFTFNINFSSGNNKQVTRDITDFSATEASFNVLGITDSGDSRSVLILRNGAGNRIMLIGTYPDDNEIKLFNGNVITVATGFGNRDLAQIKLNNIYYSNNTIGEIKVNGTVKKTDVSFLNSASQVNSYSLRIAGGGTGQGYFDDVCLSDSNDCQGSSGGGGSISPQDIDIRNLEIKNVKETAADFSAQVFNYKNTQTSSVTVEAPTGTQIKSVSNVANGSYVNATATGLTTLSTEFVEYEASDGKTTKTRSKLFVTGRKVKDVESFEDCSLSDYSGDTSFFAVNNSLALDGDCSVEYLSGAGSKVDIRNSTQLSHSIKRGDLISFAAYATGDNLPRFLFGAENDQDFYGVRYNGGGDDRLKTVKFKDGNFPKVDQSGALPDTAIEQKWMRLTVNYSRSGLIETDLFYPNGTLLTSASITDTEFNASTIGFESSSNPNVLWDQIRSFETRESTSLQLNVSEPSRDVYHNTSVPVAASTQQESNISYALDGGLFQDICTSCLSSSTLLTGLAAGSHEVDVTAEDTNSAEFKTRNFTNTNYYDVIPNTGELSRWRSGSSDLSISKEDDLSNPNNATNTYISKTRNSPELSAFDVAFFPGQFENLSLEITDFTGQGEVDPNFFYTPNQTYQLKAIVAGDLMRCDPDTGNCSEKSHWEEINDGCLPQGSNNHVNAAEYVNGTYYIGSSVNQATTVLRKAQDFSCGSFTKIGQVIPNDDAGWIYAPQMPSKYRWHAYVEGPPADKSGSKTIVHYATNDIESGFTRINTPIDITENKYHENEDWETGDSEIFILQTNQQQYVVHTSDYELAGTRKDTALWISPGFNGTFRFIGQVGERFTDTGESDLSIRYIPHEDINDFWALSEGEPSDGLGTALWELNSFFDGAFEAKYESDTDDDGDFEQTTGWMSMQPEFEYVRQKVINLSFNEPVNLSGTSHGQRVSVRLSDNTEIFSDDTTISGWNVTETSEYPNAQPAASLSANTTQIKTGDTVLLDASGSTDSDGSITQYDYDPDGDGTFEETAAGSTFENKYTSTGSFDATVRVTDNEGVTDTASTTITVNPNSPPTAGLSANTTNIQNGDTVLLDSSASTDSDGSITQYDYDPDGDGTFEDTAAGQTLENKYSSVGSFDATVRVTDDDGGTSTASTTITAGSPPTADITANSTSIKTGETVQFDSSSSTDPGGSITSTEFDLDNDGTFETSGTTAQKKFTSSGSFTVDVRVTDTDSNTDTASISITVNKRDFFVENVPPGLEAGFPGNLGADPTSTNPVTEGNTKNVVFGPDKNNGRVAAGLEIAFDSNVSASAVDSNADRSQGKSYVHLTSSISEVQQKNLYIPRENNTGRTHICPGATSLSETFLGCSNGFNISTGETVNGVTLSEVTLGGGLYSSGDKYYKAAGVTGTGGVEVSSSSSNTGGGGGGGGSGGGGGGGGGFGADGNISWDEFSASAPVNSTKTFTFEAVNNVEEQVTVSLSVPDTRECSFFELRNPSSGNGFGDTADVDVSAKSNGVPGAASVEARVDMPGRGSLGSDDVLSCDLTESASSGEAVDLELRVEPGSSVLGSLGATIQNTIGLDTGGLGSGPTVEFLSITGGEQEESGFTVPWIVIFGVLAGAVYYVTQR